MGGKDPQTHPSQFVILRHSLLFVDVLRFIHQITYEFPFDVRLQASFIQSW